MNENRPEIFVRRVKETGHAEEFYVFRAVNTLTPECGTYLAATLVDHLIVSKGIKVTIEARKVDKHA